MKRLLILLLSICVLLITQVSAGAGGLSFGIPLPFPFLFYKFGPKHCHRSGYEKGYGKDYYYYEPGCADPGGFHGEWMDSPCRPIVILDN
jgi:hypothetical protein